MSIEQKIKNILGEYSFQLCLLQQQLEDKEEQIVELKEKTKEKDVSVRTK